ncbi:MAG: Second mannosyl transferase [Candidatus Magasanikbacteria bacterium GW2011_GWC2_40_17]|uniref:Second mannosyl transferase n=1 Tax=Candidatus Magasanikbacteria bacterium GW2011_GWA2_42_32 TaxID=1619039 RepID=A0A0G1A8K6_9BACT|nr:MAG: Second mannosyl transferase [Candidatus Magasanikbacteria bacterium GW2011_GWC2_40_17]KKS57365.1 MAG: Second mannosyl transferase [Candidatus Magasanikbacteria bacterium GW2011_GWA2_42_32]
MEEKKKKILYLATQGEWGGAQKYIFDLATNLTASFDIIVAVGLGGTSRELLNKLQEKGIKTLILKHLKRKISLWNDVLAVWEIVNFLRKNNFDIIHLNSSKAGMVGAIAGWINKKAKIIYTAHGWVYLEPLSFFTRRIYLWMEKMACQMRSATIVLSEKEKVIALKYETGGKKNTFVIHNGIDLEKINFLDKETAKKEIFQFTQDDKLKDCFILGTIANFYKTKGLSILLNIFQELVKTNDKLRLVIIGNGPEKNNLEKQIKENGLEKKVVLTGILSDAYKYLKAFDIFVLPSIKEGFPYALLEAMAAGLPIVATKVGAIPEIIEDEKEGLVVSPQNNQELKEKLEILINEPDLRKKIGESAKEKAQKYNLKNTVLQTKNIYNSLFK